MTVSRFGIKSVPIMILLFTSVIFSCNAPLRFSLLFSDAEGLEKRDRVMMRGIEIGKVINIDLDEETGLVRVDISISPKYSKVVHSGMLFTIESGDDGHYINVQDTGSGGERVSKGSKIRGRDSPPSIRDKIKEFFEPFEGEGTEEWRELKESLKRMASDLKKEMEKLKESERFKEFFENLGRLRKSIEREGEEDLKELKEKVDELEREFSKVEKELKKESKEKVEKLREKFDKLKEKIEEMYR